MQRAYPVRFRGLTYGPVRPLYIPWVVAFATGISYSPRVDAALPFEMLPQPDQTSCGPTCLHAVYRYFGDDIPLEQVIREVPSLETGGTLGVMLACHALQRGYEATIYTYNLQIFDPSWFADKGGNLQARLRDQAKIKKNRKLRTATRFYQEFIQHGGTLHLEDLTPGLLRRFVKGGIPVLTGLSSTFLYRAIRERPETLQDDDLGGEPTGHFVVLCGYNLEDRSVRVADPYKTNPFGQRHQYEVPIERVICSILLGILTYDANLLILQPAGAGQGSRIRHADPAGG